MPPESQPTPISLRPFPYPFRAGLALCSDIDGCDRATFLRVHRLLNDPHRGLGLPVADSFFPLGREAGQLAWFLPDGRTPGPHRDLLLAGLESGLIDAIHSWGDFNGCPPNPSRLRALAEECTNQVLSARLRVPVWINHGDRLNLQNLPARLTPSYQGDDPTSPYYTSDLIRLLGVKFAWCSELVPWPLSSHRPRRLRLWARLARNAGVNLAKLILGRWRQRRTTASLTRLCQSVTLADGSRVLAFNRFNRHPDGIWGRPHRHTLRHSLHPRVLADLLAQEGYLIIYTHLGRPLHRGGDLFPAPDSQALLRLAAHYHAGRLWVAPTSHLLNYWLVRHHLVWRLGEVDGRQAIHLVAVDDPVTGRRRPRPEELAGLCFYSPRPENTALYLGRRKLPAQVYPPDHTGQASLGLPPPPPPALVPEEI